MQKGKKINALRILLLGQSLGIAKIVENKKYTGPTLQTVRAGVTEC